MFRSRCDKVSTVAMITVLFFTVVGMDAYGSHVLWPIARSTNNTKDFVVAATLTVPLTLVAIALFGAFVFHVYVFSRKDEIESPLMPKNYEAV
jgi:hypothetical protein